MKTSFYFTVERASATSTVTHKDNRVQNDIYVACERIGSSVSTSFVDHEGNLHDLDSASDLPDLVLSAQRELMRLRDGAAYDIAFVFAPGGFQGLEYFVYSDHSLDQMSKLHFMSHNGSKSANVLIDKEEYYNMIVGFLDAFAVAIK